MKVKKRRKETKRTKNALRKQKISYILEELCLSKENQDFIGKLKNDGRIIEKRRSKHLN